jgi:preprotein translocase subunit SecG
MISSIQIILFLVILFILITLLIYLIRKENYDSNIRDMRRFNTVDSSGSVWINPSFNIAKEDTGLSWVL